MGVIRRLVAPVLAPLLAPVLGPAAQDRALANARVAATELARRRVQREEVELFLARREERVSRTA